MALATIPQAITRGDISVYLSGNDNAKGDLFGPRIAAKFVNSNVTILMVTDALRWGYEGGAQTAQSLRSLRNYLIWLIGKYGQQAEFISQGAGGGSVIPSGSAGFNFLYLIPITAADFTDATTYNDTRIPGKQLKVYWNNINRFLLSSEFSQPVTGGITILIDGFDAQGANSDAEFDIFIVNPTGSNQNPTPSNTRVIS